jgi:hypothetical protein
MSYIVTPYCQPVGAPERPGVPFDACSLEDAQQKADALKLQYEALFRMEGYIFYCGIKEIGA